MAGKNKRKYSRVNIQNIVSYICLDDQGRELSQGAGEAVNIGCGGMLLCTHQPIESEFIVLMSFNLQNDISDIKGRVVHSRPDKHGKYVTGIEFVNVSGKTIESINQLIETYNIKNKTPNKGNQ